MLSSQLNQTKEEKSKEKIFAFALILYFLVEKEGIKVTSQEFLLVFLLSVLSSNNDTNLATNTNILLLLLLGLSGDSFGNNNTSTCTCRRCLGNFFN